MEISKPLVSILLAVYKPNETWLIEQLVSLNEQTYGSIELLVYDDCPEFPINEKYFEEFITKFRYTLIRGKKNQGSNIAFEELTKIANGELLAYCDQDDIWETNKIEILVNLIKKENAVLAYSDVSIIDRESNITAGTLRQVRPRLKYVQGYNLFNVFFFNNCVAGCCMLVSSKIAKKAIPFSKVTLHDHWVCIIASFFGKIVFIDKTLVRYRIHGNNQTGILNGVYTKKDYYNIRVLPLKQRIDDVNKSINYIDLSNINKFYEARISRKVFEILKYRYLSKMDAYFELIIKFIPNWLFKIIINILK